MRWVPEGVHFIFCVIQSWGRFGVVIEIEIIEQMFGEGPKSFCSVPPNLFEGSPANCLGGAVLKMLSGAGQEFFEQLNIEHLFDYLKKKYKIN